LPDTHGLDEIAIAMEKDRELSVTPEQAGFWPTRANLI
jgi:hypothetical protein